MAFLSINAYGKWICQFTTTFRNPPSFPNFLLKFQSSIRLTFFFLLLHCTLLRTVVNFNIIERSTHLYVGTVFKSISIIRTV